MSTLAALLAASVCLPASAETYANPDDSWWRAFLEALEGDAPDPTAAAQKDRRYQDADEFGRDQVLRDIVAEMEAQRQQIDATTAVVTRPIRARLGDYSGDLGGLPPLGATWAEAREQFLGNDYYYMLNTATWYPPMGPQPVYVRRDGAILTLQEPDADKGFRVYLQPVDRDWGQDTGMSFNVADVLGQGGLDTDGLGAGLNCGTPDVADRCGVFRFEPAEGGHTLTAAWGIIKLPSDVLPDDAVALFSDPAAFDTAIMQLGYGVEDVRIGRKAPRTNGFGVTATMALAGRPLDEAPVYDPVSMTTGGTISSEIEIFAIEGAEGRTPVLYVLSR